KAGEVLTWRDMAVLLPSRSVVLTELENVLRRRGVPYVVTKGIGFWQRQEIRDLVNLAVCLADAGNDLALFAVLRGPIGQRSDTECYFFSQLGRGSIERGLAFLRHRPAPSEALAPIASDPRHEEWNRLPARAQTALSEFWQQLAPANRESLAE